MGLKNSQYIHLKNKTIENSIDYQHFNRPKK